MTNLRLRGVQDSKVDRTRKLIYDLTRETGPSTEEVVTIEVAAIQKGDGKYILCVPTQTNCAQACRFCHTTEMAGKVAVSNLLPQEMAAIVEQAWANSAFAAEQPNQPLLVSFMGVGEPTANLFGLIRAMSLMKVWATKIGLPIRFGMATMLPEKYMQAFKQFTNAIATLRIPLKVHLSLHYTTTKERKSWMPTSAPVDLSIAALQRYRKVTGNPIEIHYTLIAHQNDWLGNAAALVNLLESDPVVVKLLRYNPLPGDTNCSPDPAWIELFRDELNRGGIESEFYASPGADIQAACGMFLAEAYAPIRRNAELVQIERENKFLSIDVTELVPLSKMVLPKVPTQLTVSKE